jgi:hypothetical protein
MKTATEIKFDKLINEGFHEILKPLGFKKKANNFYLQRQDLGQIINIQKNSWYSKDHIHFTINTGLFLPEHWLGLTYNQGKGIPLFPTEPECLIRKRIGELKGQHDTWYDIEEKTDENKLIIEMQLNLEKYILPYFDRTKTKEAFLNILDSEKLILAPLGKLIVYAELKQFDKAKNEYLTILKEKTNPLFLETVKEYGKKYGLI